MSTSRLAYLDCFAGVSGDMTVGALLALGVPLDALREALARLPLEGYDLSVTRLARSGIAAIRFEVTLRGLEGAVDSPDRGAGRGAGYPPDTAGVPAAPRGGPLTALVAGASHRGHEHPHPHGHRRYADIRRMLTGAGLSSGVRDRALAIFASLAEAEGRVHGVAADDVTFHEVGTVDSIVDVVGTAVGLDYLGVDRVAAAPLPLGRGLVPSQHGPLPLPAPAVVELCRGLPVVPAPVDAELVTPTGAAIVAALAGAAGVGPIPAMTVEAVGYGAGSREFRELPNLLRIILGRPAPGYGRDRAVVLETNLDDMNPQLFEPLAERLAGAGALDVTLTPVQMKKGRPGVTLSVLCRPADVPAALAVLFAESTAIGVRSYEVDRATLRRALRAVMTPYGEVAVKVSGDAAAVRNLQPEYEACRRVAEARGVPVKAVHAAALAAAQAAWPPGSPFPDVAEPPASSHRP